MTDRLLTPAELAERLQLAQRTISDMRYRGSGPRYIKLSGRGIRYREADVSAWLRERERTSTSDDGGAAA